MPSDVSNESFFLSLKHHETQMFWHWQNATNAKRHLKTMLEIDLSVSKNISQLVHGGKQFMGTYRGPPPVPPPEEIPLVSLNKALLGHYFLGRVALGVPLGCHEQCYSNFHTFQLGFQPTLMPRTARKVTGSADDPTGLPHLLPIKKKWTIKNSSNSKLLA